MSVETTAAVEPDWRQVRKEWLGNLNHLAADVRGWAQERGWRVESEAIQLEEPHLATYTAPVLVVHAPNEKLYLEPVAREVMGAEGRVDLYSYPSLVRIMLLRKNGEWILRPELGPRWPDPWNEATFLKLAESMASAE